MDMSDAPHSPVAETLDDIVRRVDPDRWLASRFIGDAEARADVIAVYAFNDELARIAPAVTNPLMGEIRLAWWREALDEISEGRPVRRHPVAEALAVAVARRRLQMGELFTMVEGRAADLNEAPFADKAALHAYLDATAGAVMAAAAQVLGAVDAAAAVRGAARGWGIAGLARSHWVGAMRNRLPADWTAKEVGDAVTEALSSSTAEVKTLPVAAFPAVAYATLARDYAARRDMSDLGKRARLVWATVRGQL
jgi:phytoene synthase